MQILRQSRRTLAIDLTATILLFFALSQTSQAQSTNIEYPTPVVSNEISGVIEARDVGDARLTRHYYLLVGTQGDIVVSVESNNLNGDVDLFTAGSLRPLTKLSIFSGLATTSSSKSVFLRRRETLILRVEARSASEEPGRYRVRFSGGFEPMAEANGAPENVDPTVSESRSRDQKVRRVNSAGARINEPLPTIASSTDPTETIPPATVEADSTETKAEPEPPPVTEPPAVKPTTPKPVRPPRTKKRATRTKTTTAAKKKEDKPAATSSPATTVEPTTTETTTPEPVLNPRLIIETRDGMRVERYMSEVRRVTVERGLLIVITADGKVERRPMTSVLRVAIEP